MGTFRLFYTVTKTRITKKKRKNYLLFFKYLLQYSYNKKRIFKIFEFEVSDT